MLGPTILELFYPTSIASVQVVAGAAALSECKERKVRSSGFI
jgi:hypothetical protein